MKIKQESVILILVFVCSLIIIIGQQKSLLSSLTSKKTIISSEKYFSLEKKAGLKINAAKKIPSLGFDNLLADWSFLNFVQYYGDVKARNVTGYALAPDYFEMIVKRDPRFVNAYFFLEPATTLFAGKPEVSISLMNEGLKSIQSSQPLAYQVWLYKGLIELLFLNDVEEAKKSYRIAGQWAKIENRPESLNIGLFAEDTANFLEKKPDSKKVVASAWLMIFANARDKETRAIAQSKITELGGQIKIEGNRIRVELPEKVE